ncbi:MAG TPA: acriflavin resistance protein, partial [Firmicutes bacterium]|nr:acriflavin resistance protein [Bacillota bacterium]
DAVSSVEKIDTITSTSQEGLSTVTIQFTQDADIDVALQDVQRKVNGILSSLPDNIETPAVSKMSMEDMPVLLLGATSDMKDTGFYQLTNDLIKPQLSKEAGVGQITIFGGLPRQINVNLDAQKLRACALSALEILQTIQSANVEYPTGTVKDKDLQYTVRLAGKFATVDDIRNLVVSRAKDGGEIKLSDIAEIEDGQEDYNTIVRVNGRKTIGLMIQKQSDANAVEVCQGIEEELRVLEAKYRNIHLHFTEAFNTSTYTVDSANAVKEDLMLAVLLVAGVMLLFLHSLRNAVIVMIAIPTSLISSFIGMWAFDFSLNLITLLALSLVIGILVDDAIVVLENIYRHLERGKDKRQAALDGRNEIGFTALSITMVDIVVYLPLSIVSGLIGGILREFSIVIVISTLMSLFVSFTVTPLLASRFGKLEELSRHTWMGRFGLWFERQYQQFTTDYLKLLKMSLAHPGRVLLTAAILFVLALSLIPTGFIGAEFMAQTDQGQLQIELELPPGTKIEDTSRITQDVEKYLSHFPEVATIFSAAGVSGRNSVATNSATLYVSLVDREKRMRSTSQIAKMVQADLARIPGLRPHVSQSSNGSAPVQIAISGPTWHAVSQTADRVLQIVSRIPGTGDVRLSSEIGQPEMQVQMDRAKMPTLGLNVANVGQTLQVALAGDTTCQFRDSDGTDYNIQVRLDQFDRSNTDDLGNLTVKNDSGQLIPLNQFTIITSGLGPTQIERRDRMYAIVLSSQAYGRAGGDIGSDITKALAKETFPAGISFDPVGNLKNQAQSFASLGLALLAAIIFVYLIMAALYDSFIYPFSVLFSIPLAIIGALLALALTQNSLAVFSIMGIIMQIGLVSKNAILLVDFTNRARENGYGVKEALLEAGRQRLRPILMTTLTMILGMLPLALSSSASSEFKKGLGWALIGGLTCSMLMTLVVVPVVYTQVDRIREYFAAVGQKLLQKSKSPLMK